VWIDRLGDRAWIFWARATVQQDHAKVELIRRVALMFDELKDSEEGH
jgi:hypothetical protein